MQLSGIGKSTKLGVVVNAIKIPEIEYAVSADDDHKMCENMYAKNDLCVCVCLYVSVCVRSLDDA